MPRSKLGTIDHVGIATGASDVSEADPLSKDDTISGRAGNSSLNTSVKDVPVTCLEPSSSLLDILQDAERLLTYAAEIGLDVDEQIRSSILRAKATPASRWNEAVAADLLEAFTRLSAELKPITADTLACSWDQCEHDQRYKQAHKTTQQYLWLAVVLALFIVPLSVIAFVSSAISVAIRNDIKIANELAVKLTPLFWTPMTQNSAAATSGVSDAGANPSLQQGFPESEKVTELQSFASKMRAIHTRARQLNRLTWPHEDDHFESIQRTPEYKEIFQLPLPLPRDLGRVTESKISGYQDVRSFAENVVDDIQVRFGALTACVLPVLYALLGACAYLLRFREREKRKKTLHPSFADTPRFLIAGIGGAVVGLFNSFTITQQASIPPLAIAFLVGYAVDVFYSFLEGLLQAFARTGDGSSAPAAKRATSDEGLA